MKNPKNLLILAVLGGIVGTGFGYTLRAITNPAASTALDSYSSEDITALISQQQRDWNDGDIEGFMSAYWRSEKLRFSSGGDVTKGWQATLDRYKIRYPDRATMGTLELKIQNIEKIGPSQALVTGQWGLYRTTGTPSGLFTLHMKQIDGAWVIVSDHTSSAN